MTSLGGVGGIKINIRVKGIARVDGQSLGRTGKEVLMRTAAEARLAAKVPEIGLGLLPTQFQESTAVSSWQGFRREEQSSTQMVTFVEVDRIGTWCCRKPSSRKHLRSG